MESNMPEGIFINNIIEDIQNHIDHIRKIEDKEEFKNVSKTQIYKNLKIDEDVNLEDIEIKELSMNENKLKKIDKIRNKHLSWFFNKNFSCVYDSITIIYINALYKYVETLNFNLFITEENFKLFSEHYNKYIKFLIDILSKQKDNLFFYSIYNDYIKNINNQNFLDIKDDQINNELLDDIPISSTLIIFYNT